MRLFRLDRNKKNVGSIATYIRRSSASAYLFFKTSVSVVKKSVWLVLDVLLPNWKGIRVVTLHRPPSGKIKLFLDHVEILMKRLGEIAENYGYLVI